MREFLFLIFLVAVHSSSHVNSQRKDITNRVSINSQMDVEYNDNNANNDQNDDTASTGYYYNYYYYGDDGSNDDAANDDQNDGGSPDYPTIVTTFAPVVLLTNIPFAVWTYVPDTPNPTRTPTLAVPTLRPSSPIPTASLAPSRYPTLTPSRVTASPTNPPPTRNPTYAPSRPTMDPTLAPSSTPTTPIPTTLTPTCGPTLSPTRAPIPDTDPPTYSPTTTAKIWELGFPKSFSKSVDSVVLKIGTVVLVLWVVLLVYWVVSNFQKKKWTLQGVYNSLHTSNSSDKNKQSATTFHRRKIVKNKYEDYWGEDSEDNSLSNFPIRSSTLGRGYGYGTGRSISLVSPSDSKTTPSYEDYWDENIDFSIRSSDSFGIK